MTVIDFTSPGAPESANSGAGIPAADTVQHASVPDPAAIARFGIGEVVRHKLFPFRGVIFDVDPEFSNSEEWWEAIPENVRPRKDQPYYHLLAENDDSAYVAYVSQQNLIHDDLPEPVQHPAVTQMFAAFEGGRYILRPEVRN
ncbi:heat shock protein HspQ [Polymorphobacter megasporae]|uniref:heat shock protein HspQ n=1 Tax=Glacieibacterium megasporae TaxID=2835787 RepID=UPI001C1E6278|nr:heat shock protein HspQ [Polymorphobacter megasporae]UAJ10690.1 heat shock protein HspQ [Polymorphobacter megasporae]